VHSWTQRAEGKAPGVRETRQGKVPHAEAVVARAKRARRLVQHKRQHGHVGQPRSQHAPGATPSVVTKTPISVAAYSVLCVASSGSSTKSSTGVFGRSFEPDVEQSETWQLTSLHEAPPVVVVKICPCKSSAAPPAEASTANPEKAA